MAKKALRGHVPSLAESLTAACDVQAVEMG